MLAQPSWDHDPTRDTAWRPVDGPEQDDLAGEAVWRWLLGKSAVAPTATVASGTGRDAISLFEEGQLESPRTEKQRILAIFDSARAVASAAGSAAAAEALLGVLGSPATEEAVRAIMAEGWAHSTNEWRGPRRQSKACNPSGTNPADLDAMHALAAAGAAALPPPPAYTGRHRRTVVGALGGCLCDRLSGGGGLAGGRGGSAVGGAGQRRRGAVAAAKLC
eukprot:COSAG01_NODE_827_length_13280_cov_8.064107_9_plen_220_part_00